LVNDSIKTEDHYRNHCQSRDSVMNQEPRDEWDLEKTTSWLRSLTGRCFFALPECERKNQWLEYNNQRQHNQVDNDHIHVVLCQHQYW